MVRVTSGLRWMLRIVSVIRCALSSAELSRDAFSGGGFHRILTSVLGFHRILTSVLGMHVYALTFACFVVCRLCIANERIPATLRTNFADLMRACYLMRPNVDYISPLKTTYMFKEIRGTSDLPLSLFPAPLITAPSECDEFEDLKRDCVILLSSHSVASIPESEPGQNDLTYAITKNVSELVHLGFFQVQIGSAEPYRTL